MTSKPEIDFPDGPPPTELEIVDITEGTGTEAAAPGVQYDVEVVQPRRPDIRDRKGDAVQRGRRDLPRRSHHQRRRRPGEADPRHGVGHRRHRLGADERRDFQMGDARGEQRVDQVDPLAHGQRRLGLQPRCRALAQ